MKHLLKITSAVLVLLLCALGGVFLWRSGFFAALSSQQALQDYISQFAPYSQRDPRRLLPDDILRRLDLNS